MSSESAHERPSAHQSPLSDGAQRPIAANQSVNGWAAEFVESEYRRWKSDASSVDPQWQQFFLGFELGVGRGGPVAASDADPELQRRVDRLIEAYRARGHFAAQLDPLGVERPFPAELNLEAFGLSDSHCDLAFDAGSLPLASPAKLGDIVACLEDTYCRTIGVEFAHLTDEDQREWLRQRMESSRNRPSVTSDLRMRLLEKLVQADGYENFAEKRYTGKKRFGLEGGESLIPLLDQIAELAPQTGVREITMGMAHRGRVNVLANFVGKRWEQIWTEFDESWDGDADTSGGVAGGDVKYHQGYSSNHLTSSGGSLRITMTANPSHLEFAASVVLGRCRARQQLLGDAARTQVVPILIHGDAALPGQGTVSECLNMMRLDGYRVGGSIHVVINNQVGFTTDPSDDWSGNYCTDIAKAFEAPIFHVSGDDVEACAWVARLALEWRQTFGSDVFIDMVCFRKHGHNETDEPSYTQPLLYSRVRKQKPVLQKYAEQLIGAGMLTAERFAEMTAAFFATLDAAQTAARAKPVYPGVPPFQGHWSGYVSQYSHEPVETGVAPDRLRQIAKALGHVPDSIVPFKTILKTLATRAAVGTDEAGEVDWAMGEMLAYGSLLLEGHPIRLTGQDVERGTFSHRHAVVRCQQTEAKYTALNHLREVAGNEQASLHIHNSPLTETACVGFEFGYALTDPKSLVIWEAQFGDFANSAQVMMDQFLASAEVKWRRSNGLTLLLPHGYEGQGPEHSSARLERFLQLCADDNLQVVYPTTSAQMFHLLRRQVKQRFRKPLVVMTPKSMLRAHAAMSHFGEFTGGHFRQVLQDPMFATGPDGGNDPASVTRVLLCSGKLAHELMAWREKSENRTTAVVRLEQLYPFPEKALSNVLALYPKCERMIWVQEEPRNMGAYRYCQAQLRELHDLEVGYIGRPDSATPACGSTKVHAAQQEKILLEAMGPASAKATAAAAKTGGAKSGKA